MIVTNYDDAEWREAARAAGACAYVLRENLLEVRRILSADRADGVSRRGRGGRAAVHHAARD